MVNGCDMVWYGIYDIVYRLFTYVLCHTQHKIPYVMIHKVVHMIRRMSYYEVYVVCGIWIWFGLSRYDEAAAAAKA